jgi:hypothetical protein
MRDKRFILILAAVATPVAAWLTFEAMVAPAQPTKASKAKQVLPAETLAAPAVSNQSAQVFEPPQQLANAIRTTPPSQGVAATAATSRKDKASLKAKDTGLDDSPKEAGENAASTVVAAPVIAAKPTATQTKPRSPEELCSDRNNFITRSLCEASACNTAEWSAHPFCVKRRELEERSRPASIMGGGN